MVGDFLNKTVTILRPTETESVGGAVKLTDASHLTDFSCCINPLGGSQIIGNDKRGVIATHKMYCLPADIKSGDIVVYGSERYRVEFVKDPMGMGEFLQIDLLINTTEVF